MIYISAQPNTTYFAWQLEIQLRNFHVMGLDRKDIHILIGYDEKLGLKKEFSACMEANKKFAVFHCYPDLRENPKYTSSIRPHLLKQHFEAFPYLSEEKLFYHDSDILFSRLPSINMAGSTKICYVSDTRNYLDKNYILRSGSEELLGAMLDAVGLPLGVLEREDRHSGGAQYILNGITPDFWAKVEKDSEELYQLMNDFNTLLWEKEYSARKEFRSKKRGIQAWCADMWAVLWNLWLFGKKVEIHPELDFSWPYSPIEDWKKMAIQHYSGNVKEKEKFFKKNEYLNYVPWYDDALDSIPDSNCSYEIVRLIRTRKAELDNKREYFGGSCIVLVAPHRSEAVQATFELIERYIKKAIAVEVYLLAEREQRGCSRKGVFSKEDLFSAIKLSKIEKLLLMPINRLLGTEQIRGLLSIPVLDGAQIHATDLKQVYKVDKLFVEVFSKVLDVDLLHQNLGKFNVAEIAGGPAIIVASTALIKQPDEIPLPLLSTSDGVAFHQAKLMDGEYIAFDLT